MSTFPDDDLQKAWGRHLYSVRKAEGWTQHELAKAANLRQGEISRIEKGHRYPTERVKFALAGVLRKSVGDLFPYSPTPPPFPQQQTSAA